MLHVRELTASLTSTLSSTGGGDSTAAAPPFFLAPFSSTESGAGTCSGMRAILQSTPRQEEGERWEGERWEGGDERGEMRGGTGRCEL